MVIIGKGFGNEDAGSRENSLGQFFFPEACMLHTKARFALQHAPHYPERIVKNFPRPREALQRVMK
jgi:hypothetical protein